MTTSIEVQLEDARRVFDLLEKLHDLMHQPMHYQDSRQVELFVEQNYAEVKNLYYEVVWSWLPEHVQREIEER